MVVFVAKMEEGKGKYIRIRRIYTWEKNIPQNANPEKS